ncbi:MAG: hypothetical protein PHP02_06610 [Eubacteriales bacterium]|nr:hypothetical protein [Eubacteriales bacterium]
MAKIYPKIVRSNFRKSREEANGQLDIGWTEGVLGDGRPYRLECWAQDQITMVTVFISVLGLEGMTNDGFARLLEEEGLYRAYGKKYVEGRQFTDQAGQAFWSINAVIGDEAAMYGESRVPLSPFTNPV